MKTSFVSNMSLQNAMRLTVASAQKEMLQLQEETVTGRHADVGAVLGAKTARTLNLHRDLQRMESLKSTNALTTQRLAASQEALGQMSTAANDAMGVLIALSGITSQDQLDLAKENLGNAFSAFTSAANTSFSGEYLFAGINTDVMPLKEYSQDLPPPEQNPKDVFDDTFFAHFGFQKTDAAVSDITASDMQAFVEKLEAEFVGPTSSWQTNWSNASDENMQSRISAAETVQSSTNTNVDGMRYMALGLVLGQELMALGISEQTRKTVSDAAIDYMGRAISGIDGERSKLGISEARVSQANTSLNAQVAILSTSIKDMESIDTYEAATRVTTLESQLSLAYTLTSRIQNLSLLNYL
ncbi:flagellar hook-associated family protein [Shinella yambaruensis]|uniref:Flagellin n=1 Tax=Shinella yambaruensis TaxID=415996 RepID=A0ABQ5ZHH4_9HYPH|nr:MULTISPECIES: flagellar hook-associated family protein [Shinella]CAI0340945.1 Flagellar hook-associated protein flgL [Rhizobiaceae bacterium]CAK7259289.1 Flagellin [Shinella sp. WSC3-e]MCJ8026144.1 flagellar hook-associated family protein [Shinella yambaruensis]MCO5136869.1 flagellar hook-associated family protein [Shinella sp.]MCU7978134.1 flagellar hook-associated family protein [Shinella yambaruensis]